MPESSHDSAYPHTPRVDAPHRDITLRSPRPTRAGGGGQRRRISFHDADRVTLRLGAAGQAAGLRGVASEVLAAVVELLPARWTRIRDDRIRLHHIVALCPSNPHQRSVGRALATLQRLEIINYLPARGRGATATIEVHRRLLDGIHELDRDDSGRVVVPFSRPSTTSFSRKNPPTPHERADAEPGGGSGRPVEVDIDAAEIYQVMAGMPALFQQLPRHLRWMLGKALRARLARGWRPDQILAVLGAEIPAGGVDRPFRLAMWRLAMNLPGSGPRLAVLQQSWDRRHAAQQRREQIEQAEDAYRRVEAFTTAGQQAAMVSAVAALFGGDPAPAAAVVTAARRARRQYPHLPEADAVAAWLRSGDTRSGVGRSETVAPEAVWPDWLTACPDGGCVSCGQPGSVRNELPLHSVVCDTCIAAAAA